MGLGKGPFIEGIDQQEDSERDRGEGEEERRGENHVLALMLRACCLGKGLVCVQAVLVKG